MGQIHEVVFIRSLQQINESELNDKTYILFFTWSISGSVWSDCQDFIPGIIGKKSSLSVGNNPFYEVF